MDKNFLGNEDAFLNLDSYVRSQNPGPLILLGKQGLGKRQAAMDAISHLMECDASKLHRNPDFFLLDKQQDNIKVEDILSLLEKSSLSALQEKKYFLICNAENMNVQAQNKLLKLLEDKNRTNVLIFLCNQDTLLETIKSRCSLISFHPLSIEELTPFFIEQGILQEDLLFAAYLCDFSPHAIEHMEAYYSALQNTCKELLQVRNKEDFFHVLHLVREKDPENFYEVHSGHYPAVLQMFYYLFEQLLLIKLGVSKIEDHTDFQRFDNLYSLPHIYRICSKIADHQNQWQYGSYSKNDFFDLIRSMVREQRH